MENLLKTAVANESRLVDTFSETSEILLENLDEFLERQDKSLRNAPHNSPTTLFFT